MIDLNKIEAAAKSATPGRWLVQEWGLFFSTANPATVLEMVSMIRERDAVLRQALEALKALRYRSIGPDVPDEAINAIKGVLKP